MAVRSERFCQDLTGVAIYEDATKIFKEKGLNTFGFIYALGLPESEAITLLKNEIYSNELLQEIWEEAECETCGLKIGHLSTEAIIALRVYSMASPIYADFNDKSRKLLTFFDWEDFPYKGLFLLLHKTLSSVVHDNAKQLFRGITVKTSIKVGSIIKFQQFTSTSVNRSVVEYNFGGKDGTLFIFSNVTHAFDMRKVSQFPEEEEYLLLPNDGFKVTETKRNGKTLEVYLECIHQSLLF